jgi:hypothetical protein
MSYVLTWSRWHESQEPLERRVSVQQRLLNKSREDGGDYQNLLTRFALERYLYRLGLSRHQEKFILKGAMLFPLWGGESHRPTRDIGGWLYDVKNGIIALRWHGGRNSSKRKGVSLNQLILQRIA